MALTPEQQAWLGDYSRQMIETALNPPTATNAAEFIQNQKNEAANPFAQLYTAVKNGAAGAPVEFRNDLITTGFNTASEAMLKAAVSGKPIDVNAILAASPVGGLVSNPSSLLSNPMGAVSSAFNIANPLTWISGIMSVLDFIPPVRQFKEMVLGWQSWDDAGMSIALTDMANAVPGATPERTKFMVQAGIEKYRAAKAAGTPVSVPAAPSGSVDPAATPGMIVPPPPLTPAVPPGSPDLTFPGLGG